ncbi:MAG: RNA methyltransferase [Clostridia bacterium]|nr:RNA methyltransferase [Clostridia bacterium]
MILTSKSNPVIKTVKSLADKKFRQSLNLFIVEGVKSVEECISAGCKIDKIICTEKWQDRYSEPVVVSDELFKSVSTEATPQGVLAVVQIPKTQLKAPEGDCLLLDCLQDPGNLGTVIRTANAAGYEDIYLINCTDPYSPKAVRASMGGVFRVNLYRADRDKIFGILSGVPLVCADMNGEDIFTFSPPKKFCLCIGNEGSGISDEVSARADFTVKIPMRATCESLNAAVSAGIAMYALKNLK